MDDNQSDSAFEEELVRVCRTAVGDGLRSVAYFTDEGVEQLYLRSDLDRTADLVGFAEIERTGFRAHDMYRGTQLGEFKATVRMFENGYLTAVVADGEGVWVTTDDMSMNRFEELQAALEASLREHVEQGG